MVCINCSLRRHLEKMTDHYFIQKDNEIIAKFLQDQIKFIKFLIEQTSRMLLEQEDIEIKIMNLKEEQSKKVPLDFVRILKEPYTRKKISVKCHNEIIKFPV